MIRMPVRCACVLTVSLLAWTGLRTADAQTAGTAPATAPATDPARAALSLRDLPPLEPPAPAPEAPALDERATEALERGRQLYEEGKFASAVTALQRARGFAPNAPQIQRLLGLSYMALNDPGQAAGFLQAAADISGDDAVAQMLLGRFAQSDGRADEAIRRLRMALALTEPDDEALAPVRAETLRRLGELLEQQGYTTAALESCEALDDLIQRHADVLIEVPEALRPLVQAHRLNELVQQPELLLVDRGRLLLALDHVEQAADMLRLAYQYNKSNLETAGSYVRALARLEQYDRATEVLLEMIRDPSLVPAVAQLAQEVYEQTDRPAGPRQLWDAYQRQVGAPPAEVTQALAAAAYRLGAVEDSVEMLLSLTRSTANTSLLIVRLAEEQFSQGKLDEGMRILERLLEQEPTAGAAGRATLERVGRDVLTAEFAQRYAAAAAAAPDDVRAVRHYLAALVAERAGATELAVEQFEAALAADAEFVAVYEALAEMMIDQGRYDRAEAYVGQAVDRGGETYLTYYVQGRLLLDQGKLADAESALRKALALKSDHGPSRLLLAETLLRRSQYGQGTQRIQEAQRELQAAIGSGAGEEAYDRLFDVLVLRNQGQDAAGLVQEVLRRDPNSPVGLRRRAEIEMAVGQADRARQTLDRLLEVAPGDPAARVFGVYVDVRGAVVNGAIGRRRFQRTVEALDAVLADAPGNARALELKGQLQLLRKDYAAAAETFDALRRARAGDLAARQQYAGALFQGERFDEAAAAYRAMLDDGAEQHAIRLQYAETLSRAGRPDEAVEAARDWLEEQEDPPLQQVYGVLVARLLARAGRVDEALEMVEAGLADAQNDLTRRFFREARLEVLGEAKRWDDLADAAEAWAKDAEYADGQPLRLGFERMLREKQLDRAEAFAAEMLEAYGVGEDAGGVPRPVGEVLPYLVRLMLVLGEDRARARALYEQYIELDPENVDLLSASQSVYGAEDFEAAAEAMEKALELGTSPPLERATLQNNLGYLYADRGVNLEEAERLIRESNATAPAANVKDSLGWVLYKQGRFREALGHLREAMADPEGEHAVIFDHAGDTHWRMGDADEAVEAWNEAIDLAEGARALHGDLLDDDTRRVLEQTPRKIEAVRAGAEPPVAELGEGVTAD